MAAAQPRVLAIVRTIAVLSRTMSPLETLLPRGLTLLLTLLTLSLAGCGGAPAVPTPSQAESAGEEVGEKAGASERVARNPFLYAVRGEGGTSFLFGTIHLGVSAERALGEEGLAMLARSRILLTELPAKLDLAPLVAAAMLPMGESLSGLIGQARFDALVKLIGAPPAALDRLAPWAAMLQVGAEEMKRIAGERDGDADAAMDTELQSHAAKHGVPNEGLETVQDQLAVFTSIEHEVLIQLIDKGLAEMDHHLTERLYEAYLAGDAPAVLALSEEEGLEELAPKLHEALLPARNKAWMARLVGEITAGGAFIAVGTAHLLGERGLIELLEAAGFTVERVRLSE